MNINNNDVSELSDISKDTEVVPGKMFIGGLSWQTTTEALQEYFRKFGEVCECTIMKDPGTKRSRGFGFITFAEPSVVDKVLAAGPHELDSKVDNFVDSVNFIKMISKTKKIFIGGLSLTTSVEDVRGYFQQYGQIEDAMLMLDKTTQRHRGFAFVTFESEEAVERVCDIHFHEINNKMVECKRAQPKEALVSQTAARPGLLPVNLPTYITPFGRSYPLAGYPGYYLQALPGYNYLTATPISATYPQNSLQSPHNAVLTRYISQPTRLEVASSTTPMIQCSDALLMQHQHPSPQLTQHKSPPSSSNSSLHDQGPFQQTANHSLLAFREIHQSNNVDFVFSPVMNGYPSQGSLHHCMAPAAPSTHPFPPNSTSPSQVLEFFSPQNFHFNHPPSIHPTFQQPVAFAVGGSVLRTAFQSDFH